MLVSLWQVYASLELNKDWDCADDAVAVVSGGSSWKGLVLKGMKELVGAGSLLKVLVPTLRQTVVATSLDF